MGNIGDITYLIMIMEPQIPLVPSYIGKFDIDVRLSYM
jgi:hypothetical protein